MDIEKMREEFEARFPVPFGVEWRDGDYHISNPNAKRKQITLAGHLFYLGRWESWQASRESLVIELPDDGIEDCQREWGEGCKNTFDCGYNFSCSKHEQAIHSAGIRTK